MARNSKDTSGGEPRKVEVLSPYDVPRPQGDPGPINTYTDSNECPPEPSDPLGLLPGAKKRKR